MDVKSYMQTVGKQARGPAGQAARPSDLGEEGGAEEGD